MSSAKIGVNVSPEEVENLPVNGRNFANLMTLAPGATSDGNGGWASVRFIWQALHQVWPRTRQQRCWVHKTANVLPQDRQRLERLAQVAAR